MSAAQRWAVSRPDELTLAPERAGLALRPDAWWRTKRAKERDVGSTSSSSSTRSATRASTRSRLRRFHVPAVEGLITRSSEVEVIGASRPRSCAVPPPRLRRLAPLLLHALHGALEKGSAFISCAEDNDVGLPAIRESEVPVIEVLEVVDVRHRMDL